MATMTTTQILTGIKNWVLGKVGNITDLIPSQASSSNQLADKDFVNSSVATATATFMGTYNLVSDLSLTTSATQQQIAAALATKMSALSIVADNNDYSFVQIPTADATPTEIARIDRYKFNGSVWSFEYSLNNSSFTAAQWAAIQSGITALLVAKLANLPTNDVLQQLIGTKQDKLTFDTVPTQGSLNPVTSEGIANAIIAAAGVQFIDVAVLPTASAATMGKIYLVPNQEQPNASDWYVTIYDVQHAPNYYWKQVNTTSVDLSNYYTKQEVDTKVTRLQTQIGERNVTVEAQAAPTSDTLTYTNALGETANHIVGDKRIVPNQDATSGYDTYILLHLANGVATWGAGGGDTDIRQKMWINLNSNQGAGDTALNGTSVKVEADNETVLDTTWQGETLFCRISPLKHVVVTVGTKSGYYLESQTQEFESSVAGERTLNFNYQTCVVKFQPTSNQGAGDSTIEGATGTINGTAVSYGGTIKVAMGQPVTIHCDPIENYVTPADYTGTASTAELTPALVYQTTLVTISWESNLGTDPVIDAVQATVAGRTVSSGQTIKVATGTEVTVTFPEVEGYRTPVIAPFTAEGTTVIKPTVQYATDIYTAVIDSNQADKTDIANARLTVGYTPASGEPVSRTLSSGDTIKIPAGTVPTVASAYVKGYARTVTIGTVTAHAATITVVYETTAYSVSMTSNQTGDQVIAALQATVGWTYDGHTESETLSSGDTVNVPTGITPTVTFPDTTGYTKTVTSSGTAYTAAYTTEIITVALASDTGEADLSGVTITVTDTTASAVVSPFASSQYKIPSGHGYQVEVSNDVEGYKAPDAVTGTATSGTDAALTVTMTYEEQAGFVDLGLPSGKKWAIGNLVKDSQGNYSIGEETDWGTYVSWGNIIGHNEGEGYNFDQTTYDSTPGHSVAANIPSNDAAHDIALATLGTPWHLPTKEDFQELYDNTDSEWVADYNGTGVAGRKFMKKSDHSVFVFFPASGYYYGTSLRSRGTDGRYLSSSFYSATNAYRLYFDSSLVNPQNDGNRRSGYPVRPVQ